MKLSHTLLILSLGGAVAAPMFIKGTDGKPLMSLTDWIPKDAVALVDKVSDLPGHDTDSSSGKELFYKWKDQNGVWQMTQYRPTHLLDHEIEERIIYSNANIIQSLDSSKIKEVLSSAQAAAQNKPKFVYNPQEPKELLDDEGEESGLSLTTVSLKKIPELVNQAQNIDSNMKKRMETIDQMSQ